MTKIRTIKIADYFKYLDTVKELRKLGFRVVSNTINQEMTVYVR